MVRHAAAQLGLLWALLLISSSFYAAREGRPRGCVRNQPRLSNADRSRGPCVLELGVQHRLWIKTPRVLPSFPPRLPSALDLSITFPLPCQISMSRRLSSHSTSSAPPSLAHTSRCGRCPCYMLDTAARGLGTSVYNCDGGGAFWLWCTLGTRPIRPLESCCIASV